MIIEKININPIYPDGAYYDQPYRYALRNDDTRLDTHLVPLGNTMPDPTISVVEVYYRADVSCLLTSKDDVDRLREMVGRETKFKDISIVELGTKLDDKSVKTILDENKKDEKISKTTSMNYIRADLVLV